MKYWIIVTSKEHAKDGIKAGIAQSCHGKSAPLKRMKKGDYILFYSSKFILGRTEKCQEFTGIGEVLDNYIYTVEISENSCTSRRSIGFLPSRDISILPLIPYLDCIPNKKSWGYPFRFGILEINLHDFDLISSKMLISKHV